MKSAVARLMICEIAALVLAGCAGYKGESASQCSTCATAVLSERGPGGIISHLPSQDPSAVGRVAAKYCKEHHLGAPTIGDSYNDPRSWYPFVYYDFKCDEREPASVANVKDNPEPAISPESTIRPQSPANSETTGGPPSSMNPSPAEAQQPFGDDLQKFGATCASIGFQKGTPDYGNCILKLMEMRNAQAGRGRNP
jgi:hypothetical protein